MPLAHPMYDERRTPTLKRASTVSVMRQPGPSGPTRLDLLIAASAVLVNVVVAAAVTAWDFVRRALTRPTP